MIRLILTVLFASLLAGVCRSQDSAAVPAVPAVPLGLIQVLIVDGQNNHDFVSTTTALRDILARPGRFRVDASMSPGRKASSAEWARWKPAFSNYDVLVVNYNGRLWPEHVRKAFEAFVRKGGGVVFVHASNNAFQGWKEYNQMIGLGWRNSRFGKRLTIEDTSGEQIITARGEGPGAGHGPQHAYLVKIRQPDHPIMRGLPTTWRHGSDELYHGQRGPAANMTVLSTALSAKDKRGTGAHEPITWAIPYGEGRCVTMVMGHHGGRQKKFVALHCVGFQTVLRRSVEWTAKQAVTTPVPDDFPTDKVSIRAPK